MNKQQIAEAEIWFDRVFWPKYPLKVGKKKARAVCVRVLTKRESTQERLIEGLANYIATKPAWQAYAHAQTWLNRGGWEDEYPEGSEAALEAEVQQAISEAIGQ